MTRNGAALRLATTIALAAGLLLAPVAAHAADQPAHVPATAPDALDSGYVTDAADVLSPAQEKRLEERLATLADTPDRPELFVVFVDRFTDPSNALQWADATALRNNLAPDQYLLAVAVEGRTLAISAEYGGNGVAAGPLSESRVLSLEDGVGSGYFADQDWAGGVEYLADEFDRVPWPWWVWALLIAGSVLAIFLFVQLVLFLRRRAALRRELATLEGQKKRAAIALVRADEALRTSEQELGFVTAEFGDEATKEFTEVLTAGRARLDRSFELQRLLEDSEPDTVEDTRKWTDEILESCRQVDRDLNSRSKDLRALRALSQDAPATLERLRTARAGAAALQESAAERIRTLQASFPAAQIAAVADNDTEIGRRLAHADEQIALIEDAARRGRPTVVRQGTHEAERDFAEVAELHAAVAAQAELLAAGATTGDAAPAPASAASLGTTGNRAVDEAATAVRLAETSIAARPGQFTAQTLGKLRLAQTELQTARTLLTTAPDQAGSHAQRSRTLASEVVSSVGGSVTTTASSTTRTRTAARRWPEQAPSRPVDDDDDSRAAKAGTGALSGGAFGFFASLSLTLEEGASLAPIVLFTLGGVVLGAIFGALGMGGSGGGGGGGGSSSGWGGSSSSRSWSSSSSRSSSRSSSSRSSSGGGSRSSGRSGGRRF